MRWREVRGRLVSAAAALVAVGGGCTQDGAEARRGDDASAMAGADGADGVTVTDTSKSSPVAESPATSPESDLV